MAKPGALAAIRKAGQREAFDADERTKARERTPVVIGEVTFHRRRKDWTVSRLMRGAMRDQETSVALSARLRARANELEVKQIEAASQGDEDLDAELEGQINALIRRADEATEAAELTSYRLLALLLRPTAESGPELEVAEAMRGWGPDAADDEEAVREAIAFLQPALDVEDAADLARELTGSPEPDPPTTPSSENGST